MRTRLLAVLFGLVIACGLSVAGEPKGLQEKMTPQEFHAAGLDKLTPTELAALDNWLQADHQKVAAEAAAVAAAKAESEKASAIASSFRRTSQGFLESSNPTTVESRLQGEFHGWSGRTVFILENGQIWIQVEDAEFRSPKLMQPMITISPGLLGGWKLRVEGSTRFAMVKRVQ